jgi:hypothetical protein
MTAEAVRAPGAVRLRPQGHSCRTVLGRADRRTNASARRWASRAGGHQRDRRASPPGGGRRSPAQRRREEGSRPDLLRAGTQSPPTPRMSDAPAHHRCPGSGREVRTARCVRPALVAWATAIPAIQASPVGLDNGRSPADWQPVTRAVASRVRSDRSWHAGRRPRSWWQGTASALRAADPTATSKAHHRPEAVSFPQAQRRQRARLTAASASRSAPGGPCHHRPWSGRCPAPRPCQTLCRRRGRPPAASGGSSAAEQSRGLVARCVRLLGRVVRVLASAGPRRMNRGEVPHPIMSKKAHSQERESSGRPEKLVEMEVELAQLSTIVAC